MLSGLFFNIQCRPFVSANTMTSILSPSDDLSLVAILACVVASSLLVGNMLKKKSTKKTFPMAPVGVLEALQKALEDL
jgi:hypothetical protein